MENKILIIDDDANICELLKMYLTSENYEVITALGGSEGLAMFKVHEPDLVLLDIIMPKKDGWQVCREIREISSKPIIMLTAKNELVDKILSFELGADDFITKPFDMKEICARIKAVLRRTKNQLKDTNTEIIQYDNFEISKVKYELKLKNEIVDIPPRELELLYFLATNKNKVFTRDQLLDEVWGYEYYGDTGTVDVHVKRVREKINGISNKWKIKTVWGVGYKFELL